MKGEKRSYPPLRPDAVLETGHRAKPVIRGEEDKEHHRRKKKKANSESRGV